MFTRQELSILQSALQGWDGPYGKDAILSKKERVRVKYELEVAQSLGLRFQEILADYYDIETAYRRGL